MDELLQKIGKLEALLEEAMARIAELEAKGKQDSGNSSKPPSSDLGRKRKPPVEPSGRKRGGQPGHAGQNRELAPPEEVDEVVDRDPQTCTNCGESLEQAPRLDAFLRQVTETPWYKAFVKEFRLWLKVCPKCGKTTRGQMPEGVADGAFSPQLQARIGLLSGRYRLTRRETRSLARDLFGVRLSLGSVQACCNTVSVAVAEPAQTLHAEVKLAPMVHVDETGFGRCGKDRMWLWESTHACFRLMMPRRSGSCPAGAGSRRSGPASGRTFTATVPCLRTTMPREAFGRLSSGARYPSVRTAKVAAGSWNVC